MVVFGAYSTAKRFDNREGDTSPGPGAYPLKSSVLGAPAPRYSRKLLEDGYVRPDGSPVLFTERDSWVRGVIGPKVCVKGTHTSELRAAYKELGLVSPWYIVEKRWKCPQCPHVIEM